MRRKNLKNSTVPANEYGTYWMVYILLLILMLLINCVLSFFSLNGASLSIKMFTICAVLPLPIYVVESFITRNEYVEFFSEIKSINSVLKSSMREHVMQLSKKNNLKIICVLLVFVFQLAVIYVMCFVYETFGLNV